MADISKISVGGVSYTIKDATARSLISSLGTPMHFIGMATVAVTNASTTDPEIEGYTFGEAGVSAKKGDLITYAQKEFIWDGEQWVEFGDLSALGALAYKGSASGSYTPKGTISAVTASGTISEPTFTGNALISTGSCTPEGSISATFSGSELTSTGSCTPAGTISSAAATLTGNYTPAGTVAVTPTTTSVVASVAAPTATSSFSGTAVTPTGSTTAMKAAYVSESETLEFSAGDITINAITPGGSVTTTVAEPEVTSATVATGASATFSGEAVDLTFNGSPTSVSVSGTPAGTVSGSFTGTATDVSVSGTPAGTISAPTFTGDSVTPTFTGTPETVTVS